MIRAWEDGGKPAVAESEKRKVFTKADPQCKGTHSTGRGR